MVSIAALLIVAGLTAFIIWPLIANDQRRTAPPEEDRHRDLLEQRDSLYRQLADLNVDQQAGKLDAGEFRAQREEYLEAAAMILRELDAQEIDGASTGLRAAIEAEIRGARGAGAGA